MTRQRLSSARRASVVCTLVPLLASGAAAQHAALRLPTAFASGMVVQRDAPMPVWGWSAPRARVSASFRTTSATATADDAGRWVLTLPAPTADGAPHALTVVAGRDTVRISDVLVGDVWLASGQSNMEWPLARAAGGREDAAAANDPAIRELKIPIMWSAAPRDDAPNARWAPADASHAGAMSAVAYHFAREIRRAQRVPVGILNATWGGSNIETWTPAAAQGLTAAQVAARTDAEQRRVDSTLGALRTRLGTRAERDPGLVDGRAVWADPALDDATWATIRVPGLWETQGYEGMDGVAWYRTTFTLGASEVTSGARITLGAIDDDDVTWVNGVEVGRTSGYAAPREYAIPASALRVGRNVLAIRVVDYAGGGGPYAPDGRIAVHVGDAARPLAGEWRFRVGELSARMDGQRINKIPAAAYNAMVHPLLRVPIRGILWYQGESNANDEVQARAYRARFAWMIEAWRSAFANAAAKPVPFLWVQLPNFGRADSVPTASGGSWAVLRESMGAALALPATGQAVTIDVGDPADIHPTNKRDVGYRLALVARRVAYGEPIAASGPTYAGHRVEGSRMIVELDDAGAGLEARRGSLRGFAIAGADRRWVWADARIEGHRVVVSSAQVPAPVAVRYAWAGNPEGANLYDRDGLPAAPFRTDDW